nr:hypothetical protein [Tanacetum cinerariifolium]
SSSLPQHDSSIPCKYSVYESIIPRCMLDCILTPPTDESVITYRQLSGVHGVDTQSHVLPTILLQFSDINLSFVSQQATASQVIDDAMSDGQFFFVDEGIDTAYETEYDVQSSEDAAKSKSSWYWFLQCLGDDIDLHPDSNLIFITNRQKLYKNDGVRIRARCDGKVHAFTMSQGTGPTGPNRRMEVGPSGSSGPTTRSKKGRIQCLGDDIDLHPDSNLIFITDRQKVQWNGANKYQVSGSIGDRYVLDVVSITCLSKKWELTWIPYKHDVVACWNMALNDWAAPPSKTWVGQPRKKRKRSKHKDEPFMKDGDARVVMTSYKKFYNSIGSVPNRCSVV